MRTAGGSTGKETAGASDGGVGAGPESAWGKGKEGSGGNDEVLLPGGGGFAGGNEPWRLSAFAEAPDSEPFVSVAESACAGAAVVSSSRSPFSLILCFCLLTHLHRGSIKASKPGDHAKKEADQGEPPVRSELAVDPSAAEKTQKNRQDKVKPYGSVIAKPFEITAHGGTSLGLSSGRGLSYAPHRGECEFGAKSALGPTVVGWMNLEWARLRLWMKPVLWFV
jgi:hypothetical protein